MIYLKLFFEFFKIGLFAIGGGMATIPFLQALSDKTGWYSQAFITDMIAISESTPGPIGINMATYVGCTVAGVWGGIIASIGIITPAVFIVILVSKSLERFKESKAVGDAFYGLRPAVTGLIGAAFLSVISVSVLQYSLYQQSGNIADLFNVMKAAYFVIVFFAIRKFKKHPVLYIAISAAVGIIFSF